MRQEFPHPHTQKKNLLKTTSISALPTNSKFVQYTCTYFVYIYIYLRSTGLFLVYPRKPYFTTTRYSYMYCATSAEKYQNHIFPPPPAPLPPTATNTARAKFPFPRNTRGCRVGMRSIPESSPPRKMCFQVIVGTWPCVSFFSLNRRHTFIIFSFLPAFCHERMYCLVASKHTFYFVLRLILLYSTPAVFFPNPNNT